MIYTAVIRVPDGIPQDAVLETINAEFEVLFLGPAMERVWTIAQALEQMSPRAP